LVTQCLTKEGKKKLGTSDAPMTRVIDRNNNNRIGNPPPPPPKTLVGEVDLIRLRITSLSSHGEEDMICIRGYLSLFGVDMCLATSMPENEV
jgi:hypothetical protein